MSKGREGQVVNFDNTSQYVVEVMPSGKRVTACLRGVAVPKSEVKANWNKLVPEDSIKGLLALIFYYGQNDVQPNDWLPSVSVGDIIRIGTDKRFEVMPHGFKDVS